MSKDPKLPQLKLPEAAFLWSERDNDFETAWRNNFRRQITKTFIDRVTFNASVTTKTSEPYFTAPYQSFMLLHNLDVTGTPTDIVIEIEFSPDRLNWYKYTRTPFGDLRWEDAAGDKKEAIDGVIIAPWVRIKVTATGTSAVNTFKSTVKLILNG